MSIETPKENNLTQQERVVLSDLKNGKTVVIKRANKGSVGIVCDRDDYIQEAEKQLRDKEIHEEVSNDSQRLIDTIYQQDLSLIHNPLSTRFILPF